MISSSDSQAEQALVVPAVTSSAPSNDPVVIRAQMARTRAEMGATIDALQERLDPQRLKEEASNKARDMAHHMQEQVTEKVREATIDKVEGKVDEIVNTVRDTAYEARYGIADTIRDNPIPATLIGIGLAAIFFKGTDRNGRSARGNGRYSANPPGPGLSIYGGLQPSPARNSALGGQPAQDRGQNMADQAKATVQHVGRDAQQLGRQAQDQVENLTGQVKDTVHQLGDEAQDQVGNLTDQVKGTVQQAQDQVGNLSGQVKGSIQQLGNQAQDQVGELGSTVHDQYDSLTTEVQTQARRLSGSFNRTLRENPLSLGVVAIALGAAAAMIAPQTSQEDQLFGEARDQVLQKARIAADGALDQIQKVAE